MPATPLLRRLGLVEAATPIEQRDDRGRTRVLAATDARILRGAGAR